MAIQSHVLTGILVLTAFSFAALPARATDLKAEVARMIEACGSPGGVAASWTGDSNAVDIRSAGLRTAGGRPTMPDDLWHIGSNTKAMTATLAARLVDKGVADWDDTIGSVLSDQGFTINPAYTSITLADLLGHTGRVSANLPTEKIMAFVGTDADRDVRQDRLDYARLALTEEPAAAEGAFLYSNTGYVLAALMLETRADQSYEDLMKAEIFDPLHMKSAGWGPPPGEQPQGHLGEPAAGLQPVGNGAGADNPPVLNSAGRLHIQPRDHLQFLAAHARRDAHFLKPESWKALHDPAPGTGYALGWGVQQGLLVHAGSNTMWFQQVAVDPVAQRVALAGVNYGRAETCIPATGAVLLKAMGR